MRLNASSIYHNPTVFRAQVGLQMMRLNYPSSRASLKLSISPLDLAWATLAPPLALLLRDAHFLAPQRADTVALYSLVSLLCAAASFMAFRIRDGISSHFSIQDAIDVVKAAALSQLLVVMVLFSATRLDGVPRSTPLIHALILVAGLITVRLYIRLSAQTNPQSLRLPRDKKENILLIGAGRLSLLYVRLLEAYRPDQHQVIGILDTDRALVGRKVGGVPVVGTPQDLQVLIKEYAVHGIYTDRVVVGGDPDLLVPEDLVHLEAVCAQRGIQIQFVPQLAGFATKDTPLPEVQQAQDTVAAECLVPAYFNLKRILDPLTALLLVIIMSPLFLFASILVLVDLGAPLVFWQQRLGRDGSKFLLYKFRTLRPPFDALGAVISHDQRISPVGRFLRRTRLDELPQLFNVLLGQMALIGPRPLLPEDQPVNPAVRLLVRPGITGWAQVNGGKLLTPQQKHQLDEWYIRNASFKLDLQILVLTPKVIFVGENSSLTQNQDGSEQASPPESRLVAAEFYKQAV